VWHYPYSLAEEEMGRAAKMVVGEHDFTSFAAVDPERRETTGLRPATGSHTNNTETGLAAGSPVSNVRRIFSSSWERQGNELHYTVRGSGFLHHMVRNLVGTFILVGKGTLQVEDVTRILTARNRSAAGATAPASGLYLVNVEY
jgi:tRNA pseudouridine38-40 synthase